MTNIFFPDAYVKSVSDVDYKGLIKKGVKGLVFDIDNTLEPFDVPVPSERVVKFISGLSEMGFKICLLSNNSESRVAQFNETLKLPAVSKAGKPKRAGIRKAMANMGTDIRSTALIGDQVFTDVMCGKRAGIYTVLVEPLSQRDEFFVKLKRGFERIVIRAYTISHRHKPRRRRL